jgi:hypothetical protein
MGKGPDKSDYEASDQEKASASVAVAENKYFKEKYDPLLRQMRDESLSVDTESTLRGRANADTMQAISKVDYNKANTIGATSDLASATQSQLQGATTKAKDVKDRMQTSVLGTARGQAADAQTGMAKASTLATSEALTRAKNNQKVAQAKFKAGSQLASSFVMQGLENKATRGVKTEDLGPEMGIRTTEKTGSFLRGVDEKGNSVGRLDSLNSFLDI